MEYEAEGASERVRELRDFLSRTKVEQSQFIIRRFMRVFPKILEDVDEAERASVQAKYDLLRLRKAALFAMADYVNFKGEGFHTDARYEGNGWGLAQVLIEMNVPDDPGRALEEFVAAAERVLERRIAHAPRPEVEAKWMPGWRNRLRGYLKIGC